MFRRLLPSSIPRPGTSRIFLRRFASKNGKSSVAAPSNEHGLPIKDAHIDSTIYEPQPRDRTHARPVKHKKPTLSSFSLEGKTAIVTGGARGLGYVMAQALAESGSTVAIVDIDGAHA